MFPLAAFMFITEWVGKTTKENLKDEQHSMEKLAKKFKNKFCIIICQVYKIGLQFSLENCFYLVSPENFLLFYFNSLMELQIPVSGWKPCIKSTKNNLKTIPLLIFRSSSQLCSTCGIFSLLPTHIIFLGTTPKISKFSLYFFQETWHNLGISPTQAFSSSNKARLIYSCHVFTFSKRRNLHNYYY